MSKRSGRRAICARCSRVEKVCICNVLPKEKERLPVNVIVVQHPDEAKRPQVCSVPIIQAVVMNCLVLVGRRFGPSKSEILNHALKTKGTVILYPGQGSLPIENFHLSTKRADQKQSEAVKTDMLNHVVPSDDFGVHTVILVDGTWRKAKWIMNNNPRLTRAPVVRVHCTVTTEGQFLFRKEPRKGFVSTLEALCHTLRQLDSKAFSSSCDAMMNGFKEMVKIQLKHIPKERAENLKKVDEKTEYKDLPEKMKFSWGGGYEKEIKEVLAKARLETQAAKETKKVGTTTITTDIKKPPVKNIEKKSIKKEEENDDSPKLEKKDVLVRQDFCEDENAWALCETLLHIDGKAELRELFRIKGVSKAKAHEVCKIANRPRSRGARLCLIRVPNLRKSSPSSLLPPGIESRDPLSWKRSGRPQLREKKCDGCTEKSRKPPRRKKYRANEEDMEDTR